MSYGMRSKKLIAHLYIILIRSVLNCLTLTFDFILHIIYHPYPSAIKSNRVLFQKPSQFAAIMPLGAVHRTIK